jgi:hypothetical protein
MSAYDYRAQRWVDGEEAVALRITQLKEELAVLESPMGQAFLNFMGCTQPLPEAIARGRALLDALESAAGRTS